MNLRVSVKTILGLLILFYMLFAVACGVSDYQKSIKQKIKAIDEAKKTQCIANLRNIDTQIEIYYAENDTYPQKIETLKDKINADLMKCPIDGSDVFLETVGDKNNVNGVEAVFAECSHGHNALVKPVEP